MNDFVTYYEGDIRWVIKHNYSDKIIRFLKDDFHSISNTRTDRFVHAAASAVQNPISSAHGNVVKSNPVRSVRTIAIDEKETLYLKHYKSKGWSDLAKSAIFGSKAKRELENGYEILKRGILTGEPVAYGEKMAGLFVSDNFLLVKAIAGNEPINNLLSARILKNASGFRKRRETLKRLSLFIMKLHSNGILHKDLHTGNILIDSRILDSLIRDSRTVDSDVIDPKLDDFANHAKDTQDGFSIIDLHDVRCAKWLSWRTRVKNLALHLYSLTPYCSRSEIFLVMKGYMEGCLKDKTRKKTIKGINKLIISFKHRHMLSRTKRCMKNSSGFLIKSWKERKHHTSCEYKAYLRRPYDNNKIIEYAINAHNKAKKQGLDYVIKDTARISVTALQITDNANKSGRDGLHGKICVKEYKNSGIFRQIRETVFSSGGKRAWYAANGFVVRGLITPLPAAFVERRRWRLLKNSLIITEYIEPAAPVYLYVANCLGASSDIDNDKIMRKRNFIEAFSRSFKNIHKQGVYHADLKGGNILVKEDGKRGWEFFYLDLDRVSFKRLVTEREIIKNLTQLNASLPNEFSFSDRMRFYKNYSGRKRLNKGDKLLLKKIIADSVKRKHFWNPQRIKV